MLVSREGISASESFSPSDCPIKGCCELGNRFNRKYIEKTIAKS